MKYIGIVLLLAAGTTVLPTEAQNLNFGGATQKHDIITPGEFAGLSQTHTFGTARSMGMGGAFTSLGADMASASLNPAGLGMYLRNEFSITPMVGTSHGNTSGTQEWMGNNKTRFSFANMGVAFNIYESPSTPLTSLTFGISMNRIADFNSRFSFSTESRYDPSSPNRLMPTIADLFGQQLGQSGIFPDKAPNGGPNGNLGYHLNPLFWPAVLGYNGYMISVDNNGLWGSDCIGRNASIRHSFEVENAGSINEFGISMGANISNYLYVGASLQLQSVYKREKITYQEEYGYFNSDGYALDKNGNMLAQQLDYANILQQTTLSGVGINFKIGAIIRPIGGLRIGVALHTPTYYSLDRTYAGNIQSLLLSNSSEDQEYVDAGSPVQRDNLTNSWDFVSPTRLMFGASYTFGRFAIVSVDYERDWYNGIRVKNVPDGTYDLSYYKREFKNNFCATNSLRAGIEVRPLPMLALRVGGGFTTSMLKDESLYMDMPLTTKSHYISAGIGVTLARNTVLDIAYQNLTQKQTQYRLFYSMSPNGDFMTDSGAYSTELTRHFITMTLGLRF